MAVNGTSGTENNGVPHFENLLDGGQSSYIPFESEHIFDNAVNQNALATTSIISNVVDNFSAQIYRAAAGGEAIVNLGNNRQADMTTAAGAYQVQTYFLALKTSAQSVALIVSNQEKMHDTVVDALT